MSRTAVIVVCAALLAGPAAAQEARWRASGEVGVQSAPARDDTLFNPGGSLIAPQVRAATAAVNLKGDVSQGRARASLNVWLDHRHDSGAGNDTRVVVPEALFDFGFSDTTSLGAGVGIARWGTGYAWNPANPVLDPDANNTSRVRPYRRDGDAFVRAETSFGKDSAGIYLTRFKQNDPLLSARRDREWSLYGRYQHVTDGGDVTGFVGAGEDEQFVGLAASRTAGEQLELHGEIGVRSRRRAPHIDTVSIPTPAGGTQSLNLWNFEPRHRATASLLLGGQYTFENKTNLIVEYFYNGNGLSGDEYDALRSAAANSQGLLGNPGLDAAGRGFLLDANRLVGRARRHYAFFRIARDEIVRNTDLHYYLRVGLEDGGQVHGVYVKHAVNQRTSVQVGAELYAGPKRAETRLIPVRHRVDATLSLDF